jgi:hypothetical protein
VEEKLQSSASVSSSPKQPRLNDALLVEPEVTGVAAAASTIGQLVQQTIANATVDTAVPSSSLIAAQAELQSSAPSACVDDHSGLTTRASVAPVSAIDVVRQASIDTLLRKLCEPRGFVSVIFQVTVSGVERFDSHLAQIVWALAIAQREYRVRVLHDCDDSIDHCDVVCAQ